MNRAYWIYGCLMLTLQSLGFGQHADSVLITKNFAFEDGIYLSFEAFQSNKPDLEWTEVRSSYFVNAKRFVAQVESMEWSSVALHREPLELEQVWGFTLGGIPYVRVPGASEDSELTTYAGLQVRGKICYFSFETRETRQVAVSAYNPYNGLPFRTGVVERDEWVENPWMLHFEHGLMQPFNQNNLLNWIEDDQRLYKTVEELSHQEVEEKLFKCLLIYVDRNAVYFLSDI